MRNHFFHINQLLQRLGIVVLLYTLCRLLFFAMNPGHFHNPGFGVFVAGIRFDLVAISYTNLLFIVLSLLPFHFRGKKAYQVFLKSIFFVFNGIALAFNCIDLVYFRFTLKRSTADLFKQKGMQEDLLNLLPRFFADYWYVLLIWIALLALGFLIYRKTEKRPVLPESGKFAYYTGQFLLLLLGIGITILMTRGGTQGKPIGIITAGRHASANLIPIVLNTPFTILKTLESDNLELIDYLPETEALTYFNPVKQFQPKGPFKQMNVVLIILESFSAEYTALGNGVSYAPFLDSLAGEGLSFTNAMANGKRSIEGIPSILASLPTLMESPFISSPYAGNKINSFASILKEKGYNSSFFHGGNNGTMGFDDFTALTGFDQYVGRFEYEGEKKNNGADYDGNWGIWDEEFYAFFAEKLNSMPEPFVSCFFSLSSHHPFAVPKQYEYLKEGSIPIHRSISYGDIALRKFFEKASEESWYNNTLFVITADHTGPANDPYNAQLADHYKIPLVLFAPGTGLKGREHKVVQQVDIMPSVLDYLNYEKPFFSFGESFFNPDYQGHAFNFYNNQFQIINNSFNLSFDGAEVVRLVKNANYNNPAGTDETEESRRLEQKIKSVIQVYNRSMIENKQHLLWPEK